jgi:hypothetical protein
LLSKQGQKLNFSTFQWVKDLRPSLQMLARSIPAMFAKLGLAVLSLSLIRMQIAITAQAEVYGKVGEASSVIF